MDYILNRLRRDILSDDITAVRHTKEDVTTATIEHGADCPHSIGPLTGRTLQFEMLRLVLCDESPDLFEVH